MERTIHVRGTSKIQIAPDTVEIPITIESKDKKYDKTVEHAAEKLSDLKNALDEICFDFENMTTDSFRVDTVTHYKQDKNGYSTGEEIFDGYKCVHKIKLTFPFEKETLGDVLNAIMQSGIKSKIRVSYTTKNQDDVYLELLKNVAIDAKAKAVTLCNAAGAELGELIKVDYQWCTGHLESPTSFDLDGIEYDDLYVDEYRVETSHERLSIDVNPKKICAMETAAFTWSII